MSKIYIGLDFEGNPISVLLAKNREQADIAWAGMLDMPHHVEEIDPTQDNIGIHGLAFLLTSEEKETSYENRKYRKWKRGL